MMEEELSEKCVIVNGRCSSSIQVEIRLKKGIGNDEAREARLKVHSLLLELKVVKNWRSVPLTDSSSSSSSSLSCVENVLVGCTCTADGQVLHLNSDSLSLGQVHSYRLNNTGPLPQEIKASNGDEDGMVASHHWHLPCGDFDQLWEHLVFDDDDDIKNELMRYMDTLLRISERGVNTTILTVNRLILLYGPPGSGKTSLCKALAQRLSIRLSGIYRQVLLVEINTHSLFSKWFSESGKLVAGIFEQIEDLVSDEKKCLVFLLIDEVESLSIARNSLRNEPADSLRAVNALLTQLDRMRRYPNVLILATSNLSECLDEAFLDRADMKRRVSLPSSTAAYSILKSCVLELQRIGVIDGSDFSSTDSERLVNISRKCAGFSGRALRKLPVLAYSQTATEIVSLSEFLDALDRTVSAHSTEFLH